MVSYGHTLADLRDVVTMAEQGALHVGVVEYPFADVERAYRGLRSETLNGRAVIVGIA